MKIHPDEKTVYGVIEVKNSKYEINMCSGSIMDKLISFSLPYHPRDCPSLKKQASFFSPLSTLFLQPTSSLLFHPASCAVCTLFRSAQNHDPPDNMHPAGGLWGCITEKSGPYRISRISAQPAPPAAVHSAPQTTAFRFYFSLLF